MTDEELDQIEDPGFFRPDPEGDVQRLVAEVRRLRAELAKRTCCDGGCGICLSRRGIDPAGDGA